jgi:hypothetical protein
MANERKIGVESAVRKALEELVSYQMRGSVAYVQMPLAYDSGTVIVLEVRETGKGFMVSDANGAFDEADNVGAVQAFSRYAALQADRDGVVYANESFFLDDIPAEHLASAAMTVATCSHTAANHVVQRYLEDAREDQAERLFARLSRTFDKSRIAKKFTIRGVSNHQWKVDVAVLQGKTPVLFEAVSGASKNSIYQAVAKFSDIAKLKDAPRRISSVHDKDELGDLLGVLAQSSNVIEDTTSEAALKKIAHLH